MFYFIVLAMQIFMFIIAILKKVVVIYNKQINQHKQFIKKKNNNTLYRQ